MPDAFDTWVARLEARHLANLTLPEAARGLRALSAAYVERRQTALPAARALDGAGKRAAFALYYAPLHFLAVRHALETMKAGGTPLPVLDLGCGTGAVGAAAATVTGAGRVTGLDTHPWALDEARHTYADFDLSFTVSRGSAARFRVPRQAAFVVAGYVVNELTDEELSGDSVDDAGQSAGPLTEEEREARRAARRAARQAEREAAAEEEAAADE